MIADINDSVRYTVTLPESSYVTGVERGIAALKARGFEAVELKNFWLRNHDNTRYRGINMTWRDPATGQLFEFQFHTGKSFDAKQLTHFWYEVDRTPGVTQLESDFAAAQMGLIFGEVPYPNGAIRIPEFGPGR
ncbi:hypothetical protein [Amycolatopsis sp. NPDC051071]|uniref:hypothetical protein n=1 Tax=Amycolatopsis sp. NPDC051071 TaxID=3154637 RepID=UPI00343D8B1A